MIVSVTIGTEHCEAAVRAGARMARDRGIPLHVVHLSHSDFLDDTALDIHGPQTVDEHIRHVAKILLMRAERVANKEGGIVETVTLSGRPAGALSQYVARHRVSDVFIADTAHPLLRKWSKRDLDAAIMDAGAALHLVG